MRQLKHLYIFLYTKLTLQAVYTHTNSVSMYIYSAGQSKLNICVRSGQHLKRVLK